MVTWLGLCWVAFGEFFYLRASTCYIWSDWVELLPSYWLRFTSWSWYLGWLLYWGWLFGITKSAYSRNGELWPALALVFSCWVISKNGLLFRFWLSESVMLFFLSELYSYRDEWWLPPVIGLSKNVTSKGSSFCFFWGFSVSFFFLVILRLRVGIFVVCCLNPGLFYTKAGLLWYSLTAPIFWVEFCILPWLRMYWPLWMFF